MSTQSQRIKQSRQSLLPLTVSINEACRITGIGLTKLYTLIGSGRLRYTAIGRKRLVFVDSINELLAEGMSGPLVTTPPPHTTKPKSPTPTSPAPRRRGRPRKTLVISAAPDAA